MLTAGLFDGLYPVERVMLVLGIVTFVVSVFSFLYALVKKISVLPVLGLFVIAIAMIGYSRLQSVSFGKDVLTVQYYARELQNDPKDAEARTQLGAALGSISSRAANATSGESAAIVANGQFADNQTALAKRTLQQATALDPQAAAVVSLQRKITTLDNLATLTQQAQANPTDAETRTQLLRTLASASALKLASPAAIAQVASAQVVAGQREQAAVSAQTALAIEPHQAVALEVNRTLRMRAPQ